MKIHGQPFDLSIIQVYIVKGVAKLLFSGT